MSAMTPEWVGELVRMCSGDDWSDVSQSLAYPSVSPMFKRLLPQLAETDDVTGYSSVEVRACRAGIEWLSREKPRHYAALTYEFQPWKRKTLTKQDDHTTLLLEAGEMLSRYVDNACGN